MELQSVKLIVRAAVTALSTYVQQCHLSVNSDCEEKCDPDE